MLQTKDEGTHSIDSAVRGPVWVGREDLLEQEDHLDLRRLARLRGVAERAHRGLLRVPQAGGDPVSSQRLQGAQRGRLQLQAFG